MSLETEIQKTIPDTGVKTGLAEIEEQFREKVEEQKAAASESDEIYDVIVVGAGSMGASAMYHLARRGAKVLGIEQFQAGHKRGSHSGQSRLIRKAYFEHPDYVPLLEASYEKWKQLEFETGRKLYYSTGLAYFGKAHGELLSGVKESSRQYEIPVREYIGEEISDAFPAFTMPADMECLFEEDAGLISPEKTIWTLLQQALNNKARLVEGEHVLSWKVKNGTVEVETEENTYQCRKIIVTAGAYTQILLPSLKEVLKVTRQFMMWVRPEHPGVFTPEKNFPCWMIEEEGKEGVFYGFPALPEADIPGPTGLKVAHHYPGEEMEPAELEGFDSSDEEKKLMDVLRKYIPGALAKVEDIQVCMYTNSPDGHFIIDRMEGYEDHITYSCGFSGHGFKFVPVIGEILADLSLNGKTRHPVEFLSGKRFK